MRLPAALLAPLALAGCQQPAAIGVSDGWVRLAAAPGRPAAGYLTLSGGATDATLTGAESPAAGRIELHESMRMGGPMRGGGMAHTTMRPLGSVPVPAGGRVVFAPGGRHLMLFDVAPGVKPGDRMRIELRFADGRSLSADARVIAAGDAPPAR